MTNTPKPQANTLDEILDKIECYMWDEDDEPTIDATTLLTAKQQIQALITEAKREGRRQMGEKINQYAERADFFQPDAAVVLAGNMVWLSGLNEKENK